MEDGLGGQRVGNFPHISCGVLILVLVEDGLGVSAIDSKKVPGQVLILVLVEDGLGGYALAQACGLQRFGLNPCFSGGWSRR